MEARSSETTNQVRGGKYDIAFVVGAAVVPGGHSRMLWSEAFVIALPIQHSLTALDHIERLTEALS